MTTEAQPIRREYEALVASGSVDDDPAQRAVVERLARLQRELSAGIGPPLLRWLPWRKRRAPKGLYIWGGVGRGKTFLMDLFCSTLREPQRKRIHFHRMMRDVHERLGRLTDRTDPLAAVADDIAAEVRVLCFDEFFVSDIGDAMILGRLLTALFERGVVLVATSNTRPQDLYREGLQRARFLPAIDALLSHTDIVELAGDADYRLRLFEETGTWLQPDDESARAKLARYFDEIASGDTRTDSSLSVNGRPIECRAVAKGVVWFEFAALCEGPRSQDDYIELSRWYPTVIVSGVPVLGRGSDNAARRFIALIDEFYDRRVKLVASSAADIGGLYTGERLAFEFERTRSRLIEMQSRDYLHAEHLA